MEPILSNILVQCRFYIGWFEWIFVINVVYVVLLPNANTNWVKFPRCLHLFYRCRNQFNYNSQTSCVPWWDMTRCIDTKLKLHLMFFVTLSALSVHCIPVIFPHLATAFSAVYKIFALIFLDLWVIAAMIMSGTVRCILNLKFLATKYMWLWQHTQGLSEINLEFFFHW